MLPDAGLRRRIVVGLLLTGMQLECSQATVALRGHGLAALNSVSSTPSSSPHSLFETVVRVLEVNKVGTGNSSGDSGLSRGALAGIIVGSVVGVIFLAAFIGLLICILRRRRNTSLTQQKGNAPEIKPSSSSLWKFIRKKSTPSKVRGKAAQPPKLGSDKQDPDDFSDTSFVLPELGGPNPHNKFDGMEWVDIKGLDDDTLQDISTDLRKYQQRR